MKTVTLPPLSCYFSNENRTMGLRPHQHFAEVTLSFLTLGPLGFPVFGDTVGALHKVLSGLTERPFRDSTNEDVADALAVALGALVNGEPRSPVTSVAPAWERAREALAKWGGEYRLACLELAVRGVPDDIGHSDGFATYTVTL